MPVGIGLLRVAPFLISTSYLTFTFSEDVFFRPLNTLKAEHRPNQLIPVYARAVVPYGIPFVVITYLSATGIAIANLNAGMGAVDIGGASRVDRLAAGFYLAGAAFSLLHFAFAPPDMALMGRLTADAENEGDDERDRTADMAAWVRLSAIRGLVADFPSWACYFAAFVFSNV